MYLTSEIQQFLLTWIKMMIMYVFKQITFENPAWHAMNTSKMCNIHVIELRIMINNKIFCTFNGTKYHTEIYLSKE